MSNLITGDEDEFKMMTEEERDFESARLKNGALVGIVVGILCLALVAIILWMMTFGVQEIMDGLAGKRP